MTSKKFLFAGIAATLVATASVPAFAAPKLTQNPATVDSVQLVGTGKSMKVDLPTNISDVIVGDPEIADVQVRSPRQIWVFGKKPGDTTVSATDSTGRVVYQKTIRVSPNVDSIEEIFKLALPDSEIRITPMASGYLLTGTVQSVAEMAIAKELAEHYVNKVGLNGQIGGEVKVFSMLRTGTPYQVNLQVRIAEVSRSLAKEIASNLTTRNDSNGFSWGIGRGTQSSIALPGSNFPQVNACVAFGLAENCGLILPFNPGTGQFVTSNNRYSFPPQAGSNILNIAGTLFGVDVAAAFDLAERAGLSTTLAQPNLTTISGETAEFLAGGQFPIPSSAGLGATTVEFRNYGVSLQYTPIVMSDGRIQLRVRPEVSDISSTGALRINGFEVPAITTRMAETTVELGSGQSFMIAGLLSNSQSSSIDKMPGLGDVPVLGALFKSNGWRKNETELVIVVTPYLVKPVSEDEIKLPTDGYNSPSDLERILLNRTVSKGEGVQDRPKPEVGPEAPAGPDFGAVSQAPQPVTSMQAAKPASKKQASKAAAGDASKPGFSFE
jgi:pilus assembly protein CpaC